MTTRKAEENVGTECIDAVVTSRVVFACEWNFIEGVSVYNYYEDFLFCSVRAAQQEEMDPPSDAEWKRIQRKTFTRWCNEQLKVSKP